jgi:hypothetical protein
LVSDVPAGDGKNDYLFFTVCAHLGPDFIVDGLPLVQNLLDMILKQKL